MINLIIFMVIVMAGVPALIDTATTVVDFINNKKILSDVARRRDKINKLLDYNGDSYEPMTKFELDEWCEEQTKLYMRLIDLDVEQRACLKEMDGNKIDIVIGVALIIVVALLTVILANIF